MLDDVNEKTNELDNNLLESELKENMCVIIVGNIINEEFLDDTKDFVSDLLTQLKFIKDSLDSNIYELLERQSNALQNILNEFEQFGILAQVFSLGVIYSYLVFIQNILYNLNQIELENKAKKLLVNLIEYLMYLNNDEVDETFDDD